MTELGDGAEFDAIRRMLGRWGARAKGVGDDAAVLDVSAQHLVVSVDAAIEGQHFKRDWISPREIGYRAAAAALSDLAAMAASPVGALFALGVPASWRSALEEIADGLGEAVASADTFILGGNISAASELSITTTVIGSAKRPLTRAGARPGDSLYVTGRLGGPGEALRLLNEGAEVAPDVRERFAHPSPRIREALWLSERGATAAIDISDGLVADLRHLAAASQVHISVDLPRIPTMPSIEPSAAAASGEEYELAVTGRAIDVQAFTERFGLPLTEIGSVTAGSPEVAFKTSHRVAATKGYDHFSG